MSFAKYGALALTVAIIGAIAAPALAQPELSDTRLLRRMTLRLFDRPPTLAEYEALLAVPEAGRDAYLGAELDRMLASPELERALRDWAMEYLRVAIFNDDGEPYFSATFLNDLLPCPEGSLHESSFGLFFGDPNSICDDAAAPVRTVAAWWGANVSLIGRAGNDAVTQDGNYCGEVFLGGSGYNVQPIHPGCGCGPNAVFCARSGTPIYGDYPGWPEWDGDFTGRASMRRSILEEPARLLAHIVMNDRPFSDLVLGNYTMANVGLVAMYRAHARRQSGDRHPERDGEDWFTRFASQDQWLETRVSQMSPYLLDERTYRFDPRTESGAPRGIPSAGVLTMMGPNQSFARERVRAARWLEIFACREFSPPPPEADFVPYRTDPATQGTCSHCHTLIDPAATFFKRQLTGFSVVAGIEEFDLRVLPSYDEDRRHREAAFRPGTVLTPVDEARVAADSNTRLLDFLTDGTTLLGSGGTGTIGPLGFAEILVESGTFDECAVRQAFERFGGRELDAGRDRATIRALAAEFTGSGRNMRALLRSIVRREDFRLGL